MNIDQDTIEETIEKATIDEEVILEWKELTAHLSKVEISLERTVKKEYGKAAELDELLESIKVDIERLSFSEEDLQTDMESMDIPVKGMMLNKII